MYFTNAALKGCVFKLDLKSLSLLTRIVNNFNVAPEHDLMAYQRQQCDRFWKIGSVSILSFPSSSSWPS